MARRKRLDHEIKRDRALILERVSFGVPAPEIFEEVNKQYAEVRDAQSGRIVREDRRITRQAFQRDLDLVLDQYVEVAKENADRLRAIELKKLFKQEAELWAEWERSKKDEVIDTYEAYTSAAEIQLAKAQQRDPKPDQVRSTRKTKGKVGDVSIMAEMRKLSESRRRLLGLDLEKPANRPGADDLPPLSAEEAGVTLIGLLAAGLKQFDALLAQGKLPEGKPVPAALLPAGVEFKGPVIDVQREPEPGAEAGPSDDDIIEALQRGGNAPLGGGTR